MKKTKAEELSGAKHIKEAKKEKPKYAIVLFTAVIFVSGEAMENG